MCMQGRASSNRSALLHLVCQAGHASEHEGAGPLSRCSGSYRGGWGCICIWRGANGARPIATQLTVTSNYYEAAGAALDALSLSCKPRAAPARAVLAGRGAGAGRHKHRRMASDHCYFYAKCRQRSWLGTLSSIHIWGSRAAVRSMQPGKRALCTLHPVSSPQHRSSTRHSPAAAGAGRPRRERILQGSPSGPHSVRRTRSTQGGADRGRATERSPKIGAAADGASWNLTPC